MTRRKRGPIRVLFGLLLIVAGFAGVAVGIVAVIGERDRIDDEAVASGNLPAQLDFTAENREYRVFVVSGNAESDSTGTACRTSTGTELDGSEQGVSVTLGNASSVGTFDAAAGQMSIACDGPEGVRFVVTPKAGNLVRSILIIVCGALVGVLGLVLVIWGLIGRKVRV
jgi:hypothetical protein